VLEHRPHGVMVVLSPFNFPGHLPNGHIVPALLAGNTVVLKPSEFTPLVAQLMVKYWADAGLPPGVLNMVQGDGAVGKQLIAHPDINGVLFTGSAKTGQRLSMTLAPRPNVILAMELGGNNPLIVSSFSDPKSVVWTIISSAFLTTGQRCTSARRLIVLDTPKNRQLVDTVVSRTKQMVIGPGNHEDTFMGPLIHDASCAAVLSYQDRLRMQGGKEMLAATRLDMKGSFVSPGIIDVTDVTDIPDEEIFGPLLSVYFVSAIADAIAVANNTAYGLSASIITSDIDEFDNVNQSLRVGLLNWNLPTNGAASTLPFGGVGCSGNFRPSAYYAADYCAYPVSRMMSTVCQLPAEIPPGLSL
jgi:succinylglutamic semialdehyde dehydrogenase